MERRSYEKYRWFFTSGGTLVVGGKSAEQNEEIISRIMKIKNYTVFHTASPGSPFCVIKNPTEKEIKEVAIFTACFSQDWKRAKKEVEVHIFSSEQIVKKKGMKIGTFGIRGEIKKLKAKLGLVLDFQKGKLRALPLSASKNPILKIVPGDLTKEQAAQKIAEIIKDKLCYPIRKEEILQAIPSNKISVKKLK